jgi:hypothetical protein
MAQEEFEIEISRDGKVTVRTKGIKGEACIDAAELFAQLLGQEEARQLTHEYYETEVEAERRLQQKLRR